jgi:general nucleoside transport system permease protein
MTLSLDGMAQRLLAGQLRQSQTVGATERIIIPVGAIVLALIVFGLFTWLFGVDPLSVYRTIYLGAFGNWFSWQNTLQRAAPLMLTALCTAVPARLGLIVIGGEGALIIGTVATVLAAAALPGVGPELVIPAMMLAAMVTGGTWVALSGALRYYRGVNETISSLLLNYIAIAIMNQLVTGWMRDHEVVNRPSSWSIGRQNMIGNLPGMDVHWGFAFGIAACVLCYVLMQHTIFGFSCRIIGGNMRAAKMAGLAVGKLIVTACFIGGAAAGLAGMAEVAAGEGRTSSSMVVGYGYTGILIAFIARQNPIAVIPAAILLGGLRASGGLLQRRHGLPDASVLVLEGIIFIIILTSEPLYGRLSLRRKQER